MMAAALRKLFDKHTHFRKKVSIEEHRAEKNDRFLRGKQIAFMIYDHFRSTRFHEEIQGLSGLFSIRLENDDIEYFDFRWEQALLSTSDSPSDKILEGLYIYPNFRNLFNFRRFMALYNQETQEEENVIITD